MTRSTHIALTCLLAAGLAGCSGSTKRLDIGGATFVYPMMNEWAKEYTNLKGVQINYQQLGSGAGIDKMTDKILDFGCSEAPMNEKQLAKAKEVGGDVVHIPLVMGGVIPAYNLENLPKPVRFTGEVLAEIFMGKIKKWNDPKLQALQEAEVTLPDLDIIPVYRADSSGTTYIWSDYLSKVSTEWKDVVGKGTKLTLPKGVGVAQQGSEGVTGFVSRSPGALTYVELIYALKNADKVKYGPVKNKEGEYVLASMPSVTAAARNSLTEIPDDLRYSLTDAAGKDSYPISGTNWAIVYVHPPAGKAELIAEFLRWVTHEGQERCEALHYARLPNELVARIEKKLAEIK
jgi:phosphate transport system substrate-binding protein